MNEALKLLGYRSVHYPADQRTVEQLVSGEYKLDLLEQVDCITDITTVPFFKHFDRLYPNSKFILTVRDKKEWLRSTESFWETILMGGRWNEIVTSYLRGDIPPEFGPDGRRYLKLTFFLHAAVYGTLRFSKDLFAEVYDVHFKNMVTYFGSRMLIMDICGGAGWGRLCPFLGCDKPDVPFPHENKGASSVRLL